MYVSRSSLILTLVCCAAILGFLLILKMFAFVLVFVCAMAISGTVIGVLFTALTFPLRLFEDFSRAKINIFSLYHGALGILIFLITGFLNEGNVFGVNIGDYLMIVIFGAVWGLAMALHGMLVEMFIGSSGGVISLPFLIGNFLLFLAICNNSGEIIFIAFVLLSRTLSFYLFNLRQPPNARKLELPLMLLSLWVIVVTSLLL